MTSLPSLLTLRQRFPARESVRVEQAIRESLAAIPEKSLAGKTIAVGIGSRGITNLLGIVQELIAGLKQLGAAPFVFPAMGSHGGATPAGQLELLASYGLTEERIGAPILPDMSIVELGSTKSGVRVACSRSALSADHILLVNRIKPHTDFFGAYGSGLLKMSVVGLGKQIGAARFHLAAAELGYEKALLEIAEHLLERAPILGGIAILEDEGHHTSHIEWVSNIEIRNREPELLDMAKMRMPSLPFDTIDLLIIDRIGKNISGAGMDPNITQRSIHGHSTLLIPPDDRRPFVRRIFVRDLTPESHGNAVGIGMADATTRRLIDATDWQKTFLNALTSMTPSSVKIPISFVSDREAISAMLETLPLVDKTRSRVVRIFDTLNLETIQVSESLWSECLSPEKFEVLQSASPIRFDAQENLRDLGHP